MFTEDLKLISFDIDSHDAHTRPEQQSTQTVASFRTFSPPSQIFLILCKVFVFSCLINVSIKLCPASHHAPELMISSSSDQSETFLCSRDSNQQPLTSSSVCLGTDQCVTVCESLMSFYGSVTELLSQCFVAVRRSTRANNNLKRSSF